MIATTGARLGHVASSRYKGKYLALGGTDEYVNLGNGSALNFERTNPFSIAMWMRSTGTGFLFFRRDVLPATQGYAFSLISNGALRFNMISNAVVSHAEIDSNSTAFADGQWHHVVATNSGSSTAAGMKLYADGVALATTTNFDNLTTNIAASRQADIGAASVASASFIVGDIDEVAVFNVALSLAEIQEIYVGRAKHDMLKHSKAANLVGWWSMDTAVTGAGGVNDESTNSNNGTMTNMESSDVRSR